jgi:dolichol-phosphate mannosyltransferase
MKYSIVIPLKDEESNIEELVEEIEPVMQNLGHPWEMICIDDGSQDQTLPLLRKLQKSRPYLQIISFEKNYGQTSAFDAGFRTARGEFVITIDGDRQNDPADIPRLISAMDGYDLICGRRRTRKDPWKKKIISTVANSIRSRLCKDGISDTGCSLKLYRAQSLKQIPLYEGMHRFLPALFLIYGFKVGEVPVNHRERTKGETKYNVFNRSFNTIADMFAVRWMAKRRLGYRVRTDGDRA